MATHLRNSQISALVEEAVEVDVNGVAVGGVEEDVLSVAVAEAEQVSHHRHHSRRARVAESGHVPSLMNRTKEYSCGDGGRHSGVDSILAAQGSIPCPSNCQICLSSLKVQLARAKRTSESFIMLIESIMDRQVGTTDKSPSSR